MEITDSAGQINEVDASSIADLPRLLRNSISHFNILPLDRDGRFDGIRVWNTTDDGRITFVADIKFDDLRPFAEYILLSLTSGDRNLDLDDPVDPLEIIKRDFPAARKRLAPRIIDHVWQKFLDAHGGRSDEAQTHISRILQKEANNL